ncbi:PREDICTED: uncharacterized protein LOC104814690 [Tarenaya hassleriana]|uniref:uncharacterized protein LOC104814690 n=1 Tax=Tarenaya hassleriana TaxID=28532 RepID=UPI00053C23DA|nr:PREDICTED: uncharacterized protein LOC104814690 [Tarenaya hassleriana]
MFAVAEWSTTATFRKTMLTSAPIWVNLTNIPAELYSLKGLSYIASGIGEPLHTDKMRLDPLTVGEAKVKVEVQLDAPLPESIEIEDEEGSVITINANYPWTPPKCSGCGEFGHKLQSCQLKSVQSQPQVTVTERSRETTETEPEAGPPSSVGPKNFTPPDTTPNGPASSLQPTASVASPIAHPVDTVSASPIAPSVNIESAPQITLPATTIISPSPTVMSTREQSCLLSPQPLPTRQQSPPQEIAQSKFHFDNEDQIILEAQRVLRSRATRTSRDLSDFTLVGKARKGKGKMQ